VGNENSKHFSDAISGNRIGWGAVLCELCAGSGNHEHRMAGSPRRHGVFPGNIRADSGRASSHRFERCRGRFRLDDSHRCGWQANGNTGSVRFSCAGKLGDGRLVRFVRDSCTLQAESSAATKRNLETRVFQVDDKVALSPQSATVEAQESG
jgi:hypothetical protein